MPDIIGLLPITPRDAAVIISGLDLYVKHLTQGIIRKDYDDEAMEREWLDAIVEIQALARRIIP